MSQVRSSRAGSTREVRRPTRSVDPNAARIAPFSILNTPGASGILDGAVGAGPEAEGVVTRVPTVVAALFDGLPERSLLRPEAFRPIALLRWSDRARLLDDLERRRPDVLLIPPLDVHHVATPPLIARCRRVLPDLLVAVVTQSIGGVGAEIVAALRLGCPILYVQSATALREAVLPLVRGVALTEEELQSVEQTLESRFAIRPAAAALLRRALERPARASVDDLSRALGVSRRTVVRSTRREFGVTPLTVLVWGRLLRAALLAARSGISPVTAAHAAGFRTLGAYRTGLARVGLTPPNHGVAGVYSLIELISDHLSRTETERSNGSSS